ncbi:hypothetical protein K402DRAFT_396244 [Aulographum hederae CBS 113979]|uniref:Kinetochore protein Sos7 coiled-coil domain-containing protein n=1 Tax=Aulographum hederae CBS 113979 TaxID=1176131 RepID=A0A6G1GSL2_9PEZI|nr:hypothetical protein K402DRAFT_396244 [Aulographum hederae CBS 113979]
MNAEAALQSLEELQGSQELSIIKLRETIGGDESQKDGKRSSDVSADAYDTATPASLEADLTHYKEHFKKLRLSYIEQVTKEKFLRSITSDNPVFIEHADNALLEARLVDQKAALQAQKVEVAEMIEELERRGRELSNRYEIIELQKAELSSLPASIDDLSSQISTLKQSHPSPTPHQPPHLSLPLPETVSLLSDRNSTISALDAELAALQAQLPGKRRDVEKLEAELKPLELQKLGTVAAAKEARRRREEGGGIDELEARGRWYKASEEGLRGMLEA